VEPVAGKPICPGIREEEFTGYRDGLEDATG